MANYNYELNELNLKIEEAKLRLYSLEENAPKGMKLDYEIRRRHDSPYGDRVNVYAWYIPAQPPKRKGR